MGDAFKEFIISIGILLGLISPQLDPGLNIKIYKTGEAVYFSLEIENCINTDIEELIIAGNRITVKVEVLADTDKVLQGAFSHSISYNPLDGYYTITYSETGKSHRTNNKAAAYAIFTGYYQMQIFTLAEFAGMKQHVLLFRAVIGIDAQAGFNPAVLWNYKTPEKKLLYKSVKEIPF